MAGMVSGAGAEGTRHHDKEDEWHYDFQYKVLWYLAYGAILTSCMCAMTVWDPLEKLWGHSGWSKRDIETGGGGERKKKKIKWRFWSKEQEAALPTVATPNATASGQDHVVNIGHMRERSSRATGDDESERREEQKHRNEEKTDRGEGEAEEREKYEVLISMRGRCS